MNVLSMLLALQYFLEQYGLIFDWGSGNRFTSCNKSDNNSNTVLTVGWANTLDDDTHKLIPEIRFCSRTSIFKFWPFSYGPFFKSFIINTKKGILFRIVLGDESYIKNPCISRIVCEYVRHKFWVCWMLKHLFLSKY